MLVGEGNRETKYISEYDILDDDNAMEEKKQWWYECWGEAQSELQF